MSATLDELRRIAASSDPDPGRIDLEAERADHLRTADRVLRDSVGRPRKADEQRALDRANQAIDLIDGIANRIYTDHRNETEAREVLAARLRMETGLFGNRADTGFDFGRKIANAIAEVRDGRASASVEYPTEHRALAESGTGGYGVNTLMGQPVHALTAKSVVMSLPGVVHVTATTGDRMRFPRFNGVTVGAVAEAAALTAAATDLDAIDIVYSKLSSYETLSSELAEDFDASALSVLGDRMLRDLAAKVDQSFLQGLGAGDVLGIFNQIGVSTTSVAGVSTIAKAQEAEYQLLLNDGNPTAWIMHPRSWIGTGGFRRIVTGVASSVEPVLQTDPSQSVHSLAGYPVYLSSGISTTSGAGAGSTAALVDASQLVVVTRRPATVEVSRDVLFSTDSVGIRATTRVGLGVLDSAGGISLLTDIRTS